MKATVVARQGAKPIVRLDNPSRFFRLLSVDGGGLRGAATATVLCEVERAIREVIVERRLVDQFSSPDEFDVMLADYFDMMAGTSVGSFLTAYLAVQPSYPGIQAPPGSPAGFIEFLRSRLDLYGDGLVQTLGAEGLTMDKATYAQWAPRAAQLVLERAHKLFGDVSIQDHASFHTSYLATWLDALGPLGDIVGVFVDKQDGTAGTYYAKDSSVPGRQELNPRRNFHLATVVSGSSAYPPQQGPVLAATIDPTPEADAYKEWIYDGGMGAQNPTGVAVSYLMLHRGVPASRLAVLSLGSPFPSRRGMEEGALLNSTAQDMFFLSSLFLANRQMESNLVEALVTQAHALGSPSPSPSPSPPYLRIQRDYDGRAVRQQRDPQRYLRELRACATAANEEDLEVLMQVGASLADEFRQQIRAFVEDYVLPGSEE